MNRIQITIVGAAVVVVSTISCQLDDRNTKNTISESAEPTKKLSTDEIENLPESLLGTSIPISESSGLVFGITPDADQNANFDVANQLKAKFYEQLRSRLIRKEKPFFIAMAVNCEHLGFAQKIGARIKLRNEAITEVENFSKSVTKDAQSLAESNLLIFNDTQKKIHTTFRLTPPSKPFEFSPVQVTIVGKNGLIFDSYNISGSRQEVEKQMANVLERFKVVEASQNTTATAAIK
jgi:hypothetical protein